jgi:hypothetical protein
VFLCFEGSTIRFELGGENVGFFWRNRDRVVLLICDISDFRLKRRIDFPDHTVGFLDTQSVCPQ